MTQLFKTPARDIEFAQGADVSLGEAIGSGFAIEREQMWTMDRAREAEAVRPLDEWLRQIMQGDNSISEETVDILFESDFNPDAATLNRVIEEARALGHEVPADVQPDALRQRREEIMGLAAANVAHHEERLSRAGPVAGSVGPLVGALGAGATDPVNLLTLPIGAPGRAGLLLTMLVEGGINAAIEAAQTPGRNVTRAEIGMEAESPLINALFGGILGGAFAGGQRALGYLVRGAAGLGRRSPPDLQRVINDAMKSDNPSIRGVARAAQADLDDLRAGVANTRAEPAIVEHDTRAQAAVEGKPIPERPTNIHSPSAILDGLIEEQSAADLEIRPGEFQFKSDADAAGVTDKLLAVKEWNPDLAGVIMVFEYADGTRAVADGHQRVSLAKRIMAGDPSQDIKLAARVFREADGFTVDQVRMAGAIKNIAEAADGMTTKMARDAAKVLRIDPDQIGKLPAGPGIARAESLSKLSDEAFDMLINELVPERYAELVGRKVEDQALHGPIMKLLARTEPENVAQADSIVSQAMEAPTERSVVADLFGEQEVVESLYIERAKVLDRALKMLREERNVFGMINRDAGVIESAGKNRLDKATNKQRREAAEAGLATVKALAHRAGPIAEALNDGARKYKETGRLKDAAGSVVDAVRTGIERGGLAGLGDGNARPAAKPASPSPKAPEPFDAFDDPAGGAGVEQQIEATRIDPGPEAKPAPEPKAEPATEATPAGEQVLFPGMEPITDADRAASAMAAPLDGGARASDTEIGGLFDANDPARAVDDMFDTVPIDRGFDEDGNEVSRFMTREELAADLDADDEAIAIAEVCLT